MLRPLEPSGRRRGRWLALAAAVGLAPGAPALADPPPATPRPEVDSDDTEPAAVGDPASDTPSASEAPSTSDDPPVPDAPELGPDEVTLKSGGFVRGTLVEVIPESHVSIVVGGDDEPRPIAYDEIERIERGKHAATLPTERPEHPPPAARPKPTAPEPAADPEADRGKPHVHIEAPPGSRVGLFEIGEEIRTGTPYGPAHGIRYRRLCEAPCGEVIDGSGGRSFFLGQDIWTASRRFDLAEYTGDLTIAVRPGRKALRIAGAVLLALGTGAAISGGVFIFSENTRTTGLALLGSGLGGLLVGTPMVVFGRTRYEFVKPQK